MNGVVTSECWLAPPPQGGEQSATLFSPGFLDELGWREKGKKMASD